MIVSQGDMIRQARMLSKWLKTAKENSDPGGFLAKTTYLKTPTDSNHFDIINDPMLNKFEK